MLVRRLIARLLDWLLVLVVAWPLVHEPVLVVLCAAVYDALLLRLNTLGKVLTGLRVVGPASGLSLRRALARTLVTTALPGAGVVLVLTGLGWREPALMAGLGWQQPWVVIGEHVGPGSAGWLSSLLLVGGFVLLVLSVVEALDLRGTRTWHDRKAGTAVVRLKVAAR
ncbi:RDD family protein [Lentzea flaviverrucosa]|uniref:RDD family protein n=1 Tax=Lentzea flaviverrucosa TaxID=200379 RepID=A0A1H9SUI4_9PSEU|nr:RDD family protein [Lentzea flaviverrucosa]RDI25530.1 RDD family protein [Lentzea flaviverrucosa]SER88571.1 RDD family protein [Lentzea flaviverrucosa]